MIVLAIRQTNGGHYTFFADDKFAAKHAAFAGMAGRKLTGPRKPAGSYEHALAAEIVGVMF